MNGPSAGRPLPPELVAELSTHAEGQELTQVWELLAIADPVPGSPEATQAWDRISAEIAQGRPILTPAVSLEPVSATPRSRPAVAAAVRRWHPSAPWAIAATLALVVGYGAWQATPVSITAPLGEQLAVTLPDGSVVDLNAGSSIEYARGFRRMGGLLAGDRAIELDGEAFFSVVRIEQPFAVTTAEAQVTVLGTKFLVRSHQGEQEGTRVAVESGRVRVAPTGSEGSAVELGAGEGTFVARGAQTPDAVSAVGVDRLSAWRRGGFWLVDQPLTAIFRELERRYAVDIRLRDVTVGDERLNVYYPERPSIETILSDLCTRGGLRYSRTSRGYEITAQSEPSAKP